MSYMTLPTIRVMREDGTGSHLINLVDFDPEKHVLPEDAKKPSKPPQKPKPPKGDPA